ncbi:MAG TPA: hypothetical protein VKR52_02435 [Terracidiphilus sp.]|nr:hypothetical protein [Terracidiphilus sp.]
MTGPLLLGSPNAIALPKRRGLAPAAFACLMVCTTCGDPGSTKSDLVIQWNNVIVINKTTPTLQVVMNPRLLPGDPLGDAAFRALGALQPDATRYQLWFPYPKLAVAELQPPTPQSTSWDFSLIDPVMDEFMTATAGHATVMDFSTIPQWMFVTDAPVAYPGDPNQVMWNYEQGTELRDPTCAELADYYRRFASWYVDSGFADENGVWHESGHHYQFPIWEVLNEPDYEHQTTAEDYTKRYDAIVEAVRSVSPDTKFIGLSLGAPANHLDFIRYFLNPANHLPEIPIDYISYHFYAVPGPQETIDNWQDSLLNQADQFLNTVQSVEAIRKQLAPKTRTDIDELGTILPTDAPPAVGVTPPSAYWNLSGAVFAYMYLKLARLQIDVVGQSQLVGFPTQYPTVSMMDWTTNQPNARFWVLKLLKDSFQPGDSMVETDVAVPTASAIEAQAFVTPTGRELLLINKRNQAIDVALPSAGNASALTVDAQSGEGPARSVTPEDGKLTLQPFAVTVVSWN